MCSMEEEVDWSLSTVICAVDASLVWGDCRGLYQSHRRPHDCPYCHAHPPVQGERQEAKRVVSK
jgi:hypothetical protein